MLNSDMDSQMANDEQLNTTSVDVESNNSATDERKQLTSSDAGVTADDESYSARIKEVAIAFAPLGLVAFGGPTAHIAILHERFVENKKWLDDEKFIELLAVGQGLPGPTSTQMVVAVGTSRAGMLGGLLAFMFWNLPSFIILVAAGITSQAYLDSSSLPDWLIALPAAAVSLVFVAAFKLTTKICTSKLKYFLTTVSAMIVLLVTGDSRVSSRDASWIFPVILICGGLVTLVDSRRSSERLEQYFSSSTNFDDDHSIMKRINISPYTGMVLIAVWLGVLVTSIVLRSTEVVTNDLFLLFESFWRIGSIIYGGGQVVLPMLLAEVVDPGFVSRSQFFQGFGLVQALPGPLFNFSSFLGAVSFQFVGAIVCWIGLFGPGIILIFAFLPFWMKVRRVVWFKCFLAGVNAAAIGLVIAACVSLWGKSVFTFAQSVVFVMTGSMVAFFNVPAPVAIVAGGLLGWAFSPSALNLAQDFVVDTPFTTAVENITANVTGV